jgi:hypothetical protein
MPLSLLFHNHFFILQFHILDFPNEHQTRKKQIQQVHLSFKSQVEKYEPVSAGKHRKSLERGSSIPTGKLSDFFR